MFDFEFMRDNWLFITKGIGVTLGITLSSLFLATLIAVMIAKARRSRFLPLRALSGFYIWLVDGIPLLLQIFFIFLVLPQLGIVLSGFWAAVVVLAVYYSARLSEVFYARFVSIRNIHEVGWQPLIQTIGREFAAMIKDSTLIATTGFINDVFRRATSIGRAEFHLLEALTIAAVIYLILNTAISFGLGAGKTLLPRTGSAAQGFIRE